jgi:glycosyltransferase involved in cell wall biosynthesis
MRITIVIGPFYPIPPVLGGAVEKVHLLLAGAYRAGGHEVTMISRRYKDFADDEVVDGIRHIRIRSTDRRSILAVNLLLDFFYAARVAWALPPADVTITNAFFLPLLLPHRRAGKIYVQVGRYPKGQMWLYSRADRLQAVSRAVGQAMARQVPWLKRKIVVIPYAIPEQYFSQPANSRREPVVLYVGRIAREKGIELLIEGFARLRPQGDAAASRGWRLRIIGPRAIAQGGDGVEYLGQLQALAQRLGVGCEFSGPIFDQDALIGEYQRGGVFVYPSLAETGESLGLAPLEAMATGCAAIVSDLRCFDDFIEDGVTGLRFDHRGADAADALAVQLARLIGSPEFLHQVAAAGRDMAGNFRTSVIARRMLDDFASLLAGQPDGEGGAR